MVSSFTGAQRQQLRAHTVSQNLSSPGNHPVSRWPLTLAAFLYALTCFPLIYLMLNKLSSPLNHCCVCSHRLTLTRPVLRRARAWSTKPRPLVLAVVCLFVCKYGLSYMFTFLWASTLSLFFLSNFLDGNQCEFVFTECKHWPGLMNWVCTF